MIGAMRAQLPVSRLLSAHTGDHVGGRRPCPLAGGPGPRRVGSVSEEQAAPAVDGSRPDSAAQDEPTPVRLRRAPRFAPFTVTGAVAGVLVGILIATVTTTADVDGQVGGKTVTGYLAMIGLLVGGVIGAGLAVLADRRR